MRRLILVLTYVATAAGCNWGKLPEDRYNAELEHLRDKQERISKQMDELARKEADRRRAAMVGQAPGQKKKAPWWKFWSDGEEPQPAASQQEQRPWWQTDAKNQKDNKPTDRPNLLFKPQKSQ